jgi:Fe2+ or Zn2+ uptake regulation protein
MEVRNTTQRDLIRRLFYGNYTHPTADEIYELARQENPKISRGTVYRNLNFLVESGELLRIPTANGPDHFDVTVSPHYHAHCRKCGRVSDVPLPYNAWESALPCALDFTVETHQFMLFGVCKTCKTKGE